ncbi:hypothetical protein GCK72_008047 [Caenorhabditis remanei]|uniref:Uncharacterized protein n=1 Tax=Caenorhabditis remanei TaxID=31234 RepID=A0A6A5HN52_CAERE|nr:hypothetical protein GCK72_008047 [Caenorhabditis remanei]KAF1768086.1 hypothetical protein GCK72_008047 [Caenorhabditis remanei]
MNNSIKLKPERSSLEVTSEYVICALHVAIFPFYAYLYFKNRKRDRDLYLVPAYFYYFRRETDEWDYLGQLTRLDIVVIPIISQMTYIGCNRQNLEFLYRIGKKCLMKLFCKGSSVQIQPYVINNDGGMETTQQPPPLN